MLFLSGVEREDDDLKFIDWRAASFVFKEMRQFYDSPVYSFAILRGLVTSSGGITESTLKASSNSIFEHLSEMAKEADGGVAHKQEFLKKLIKLFDDHLKDERVTVPLMKTLEMLMTSDYLSDEALSPQMYEIHALTVKECNKSKNIAKLTSAVGLFSSFLSFQEKELVQKGVKSLLFLLYHGFPKVRVAAAEKLYTALLVVEDQALIHDNEE